MPDTRFLCVSLHDVAPATWRSCQQVLTAVREVADIPLTLLVVPAHWGRCSALVPGFESAMTDQLTQGRELALHGYFHRDLGAPCSTVDWLRRRVYCAGEGEFAALTEQEAAERLLLGQRWFRANRWPLSGFVAPAWLLGPGSWKAMRRAADIEYVTTFTHIHALHTGQSLRAPCLTFSARAAWRRALSRARAGMAWRHCPAPQVRLALHPRDAAYPALRRTWQHRLADLLAEREAVRKVDFVHTAFACDSSRRWPRTVLPVRTSHPRRTGVDAGCCKECSKPCDHPVGAPNRKRRDDATRHGAWTLLPSACPHAGRVNTRGIDGDDSHQ